MTERHESTDTEFLRAGVERWNSMRPKIVGFWGEDLRGFDLSGFDLSGAILAHANLSGVNLEGADLSGSVALNCNMTGARLGNAKLYNADLTGVDLTDASLGGAIFSGANLTSACLAGSKELPGRFKSASRGTASRVVQFDGADLRNSDLREAHFNRAELRRALLNGADLRRSRLYGANAFGADLSDADLRQAILTGADLGEAKLRRAKLQGATLHEVSLVRTDVDGASFSGARVYGASVWDIRGTPLDQHELVVSHSGPRLTIDDLKVAQFVYLLLENREIGRAIETIGKKGVLILGRFTDRMHVLEHLRSGVRECGFSPMVFDFDRPEALDITETVRVLAGISTFIVADLTAPRSTPHEAQAVIPDYMVPFVPLVQAGERPYAMFADLANSYDWVLPTRRYEKIDDVTTDIMNLIIGPALAKRDELLRRKAKQLEILDVPSRNQRRDEVDRSSPACPDGLEPQARDP